MKKLLIVLLLVALLAPAAQAGVAPVRTVAPRPTTKPMTPAPTQEPTTEPTAVPGPTPLEPYYPAFDYDAAKADPDVYIGKWYTLNGRVNIYHEYEGVNEDGTHDSLIYLVLDDDPDKQVIIMYQRPEEKPQPKYGDTISCYGSFYKLYEQHLTIGGYITMPMFGTFYIVIL